MRACRNIRVGVVVLLLWGAAGCGEKEIVISLVPAYYSPDLKTVAVAPFRNASDWKDAGDIVSDALAAQLGANGTYKVYNRNDLEVLRTEHDLRTELGLDNAAIAEKFRKAGNVQAVLVGRVLTYAATERRENRREPIPGVTPQGMTYVAGYRDVVFTRNEANVAVTASLIRVADGSTIYSLPTPARGNAWAQGAPPPYDRFACLHSAMTNAVNQLAQQLVVTRRNIKVKENEQLRTASELYDNTWTFTDTFKTTDEKAYIVLKLPAVCDRNRFRLTIVRKGQRTDLFVQELIWNAKFGGFGYGFSPKGIAAQGGGPGEYEAKFYAGNEPAMRHTFKIRE